MIVGQQGEIAFGGQCYNYQEGSRSFEEDGPRRDAACDPQAGRRLSSNFYQKIKVLGHFFL